MTINIREDIMDDFENVFQNRSNISKNFEKCQNIVLSVSRKVFSLVSFHLLPKTTKRKKS